MSTSTVPAATASPFDALCHQVEDALRRRFRGRMPEVLLRRALAEAVETAHTTEWPALFFPLLAEERVQGVQAALQEDFSRCAA